MTEHPPLKFTPAVGDMDFTSKQRRLLTLAHELGRDKFAARAAQWDQTATFPFANYDDLREAGLLKLCVPESHGGLGADYATYMMLAAEIGRFCGATALTWNMHICSTMWTGVLADGIAMTDEQRSRTCAAAPAALRAHRERRRGLCPAVQRGHVGGGRARAVRHHGAQGRRRLAHQRPQDLGEPVRRGRLLRRAVHRGQGRPPPRRARHALHQRAGDQRRFLDQRRLGPAGHARHGEPQPDLQGRVRQRRRAAHAARHLLQGRADLAGDVLHALADLPGRGQCGLRLHGAVPARRGARRAADQAPPVPDQADHGGADAHPAREP